MVRARFTGCLVLGLVVATGAEAAVRAFEAPMDVAEWKLTDSGGVCRLSQTIPTYGRADFVSRGSRQIEFQLQLERGSAEGSGWAVVRTVAPLWQPGVPSRELGTAAVRAGATPFRLASDMAWRLIGELEQGMFPTFYLNDGDYRRDQVTVALSAVNFQGPYQRFLGCIDKVAVERHEAAVAAAREAAKPMESVYDPSTPNRATLFFATNRDELTTSARDVLDKIAAYIKQQPSVELVVVDGHADSRGGDRFNLRLSQRRAESVKAYLVGNSGLDANRIRTRSYGEKYPAVPNDDVAGWARNRRVLLLVQLPEPPAAPAQATGSGAAATPRPVTGAVDTLEQIRQAVERLSPAEAGNTGSTPSPKPEGDNSDALKSQLAPSPVKPVGEPGTRKQ